MNFKRTALFVTLLAMMSCGYVSAQELKVAATKESCLAFVQEFYGWYVPKARAENLNADDAALKERRAAFSQRLLKELAEVDEEQRRSQDSGLDFDWLLNSQDPGDPGDPGYLITDSGVDGNICRVHVSRQRPDGKGETIVPELKFKGRWFFVNFHYPSQYPQSENLLSMINEYLKAAACDGVNHNLTPNRKPDLARSIALQFDSKTADVLQSFQFGGWEILYVDTYEADEAYVFYAQDPVTSHYVTFWSGAARKSEEHAIKAWTMKHAPGIPQRLAACFVWSVTNAR